MVNPNPSTTPKGLPMTERDPLDLLDMDELCSLLKVSKKFVYREVENGRFPVVRIGRSLRFFRHDIAEYLRNGQNGSQSA